MLVLSRKKQESVLIGNDIEVIVLEMAKNRVRLGFRCPGHISIQREELHRLEETLVPSEPAVRLPEEFVCA